MITNIEYNTLLKARDAANLLRAKLLERLASITVRTVRCGCGAIHRPDRRLSIRKIGDVVKCGCGAIHHGEAEVVDIVFSEIDGECADRIGMFLSCTYNMREIGNPHNTDYDFGMGFTNFIPHSELYVIFRQVFEPIGVPTDHLFAEPYISGPKFVGSGQKATVQVDQPVYIRPIGDTDQMPWRNAQVRIDCNIEPTRYAPGKYIACKIDPFAPHYGELKAWDYHYAKVQAPCLFAAQLFDIDVLVPIVRVVEVSQDGSVATVETNEGIEFYQPEV